MTEYPENKRSFFKSRIAKRLTIYILLFSSVITLLGTSLQLYLDYSEDVESVQKSIYLIKTTHLSGIINHLWISDSEQIEAVLSSIMALPDMQYIKIVKEGRILYSFGSPKDERTIHNKFSLVYSFKGETINLGTLYVVASLESVYNRLYEKTLVILATQAIKTFLVSLFILFLFYQLVGKHLLVMATYAKSLSLDHLDDPLVIRRGTTAQGIDDELATVAAAINSMRTNLKQGLEVQVETENELRLNERKYLELFNNTSDAVMVFDVESLKMEAANPQALLLYGYLHEEFLNLRVNDLSGESEETSKFINGIQTAKSPKEIIQKIPNRKFRKKDGSLFVGEVNIGTYVLEGRRKIIGSVRDISERLNLERDLRQSQKIESLGRLAGGVAHDYNNMLSVIIGNVELGQMKVEPSAPVNHNLEHIHQAAIRSRDITRQLLAFARKQIINPKVLNLNTAVESMLKMLRNLLGENINLVWKPHGGLWPVKVDPSQLDQILANLCINARDSIADIGKMTIETDTVSFDEDYCKYHPGFIAGDFVMFAVSDDGCGMDSETLSSIFEPFFTTKQVGEGSGLGLATVYGIVKQGNGFINVYSEQGQGTTFKIYLPRCEELETVKQETVTAEVLKGQGETILLVEDEAAIIMLATAMLEELGYHVFAANSPAEALSVAEVHQGEIQLLLTDVVMPGMNGRDLAKQVQKMYPEMKTLYMSGYTANVIAHHGVLDEGINFIQKPFARGDLSIRIREALGSNS